MGCDTERPCLLAPIDFQAVKACGVTFARSMVERVIDERTAGDPERAEAIRARIGDLIGGSLANIEAGSPRAAEVKAALQAEGLWSQYLEVGIGPDAEVFTKAPVLSSVGHGAEVGLNPISAWNNPEPEVVLAVDSRGNIRGATLGNDVNLRDVEGRSALLLGKAKDNNASCAIGPFIRLFDEGFALADIEAATITLKVRGVDGFTLEGHSDMAEISRSPAELVRQTLNENHQYPDGFVLFLGTMFAPREDRAEPGSGFTHKPGDVVEIATPLLGALSNTVTTSDKARPWTYGLRRAMRDLARRGLL
jgi:fumarylacetoacetate (FAA) hydrolase family protein